MADQSSPASPNFADYRVILWRDIVIVSITAGLWFIHTATPLMGVWGYACGVLTGICALQLHEWRHIWGAFRCKADIYPASRWWHPFLFSLDHTTNTKRNYPCQEIASPPFNSHCSA